MKRIVKTALLLSVMLLACVTVSAANLNTNVTVGENEVIVTYSLDKMPTDIENIASITIKREFDAAVIAPLSTEASCNKLKQNLQAEKNIAWYSSSPLTKEELEAVNGLLYTVTYKKAEGASGITEIEYPLVKFTDYEGETSKEVSYKTTVIDLGLSSGDKILLENIKKAIKTGKYTFGKDTCANIVVIENVELPEGKKILFGDIPVFALEDNSGLRYCAVSKSPIDISSPALVDGRHDKKLCGDADGDGTLTAYDALLALKMAIGSPDISEIDPVAYACADVAGAEEYIITARDAYKIARKVVE